jgi:hypothetical protein
LGLGVLPCHLRQDPSGEQSFLKEFPQKRRDVVKPNTLVPQFFEAGNTGGISEGNVFKPQVQLNRIRGGVHIACCAEFLYPGARDPSFDTKRDGAHI